MYTPYSLGQLEGSTAASENKLSPGNHSEVLNKFINFNRDSLWYQKWVTVKERGKNAGRLKRKKNKFLFLNFI